MKKTLLLLLIIIFACKENKSGQKIKKENKVEFIIDERTEFLRTVFNLAVQDEIDEEIQPCKTEYLQRVNSYFSKYKNHPLIDSIYNNENIMIDFPTIGLMFNDYNNFEFNEKYSKELASFGVSRKELNEFIPLFKDFYKKSNFKSFFTSNKDYYKQALSKIESQVKSENLFSKIAEFYQFTDENLKMLVFVELTNNANNKAVWFYDNYNNQKRAIILANICELPEKSKPNNEILELNNDIRGVLCHETSHLFTDKLLEKHLGNIQDYTSKCTDCDDVEIKDKIDHMIVSPLQALLSYRLNGDERGKIFFLEKCKDIRKEVYIRFSEYYPENRIPFENTYKDCIDLIRQSAMKK